MTKTKSNMDRFIAVLMAFLIVFTGMIPQFTEKADAATGTSKKITIEFARTIWYGKGDGGYTNLKVTTIDDSLEADRPVLCMQPAEVSPPDGTYVIDKTIADDGTGKWNCIRNIVWFTPGYPGYKSYAKSKWFDGYTKDEAIGVMHLAASYARAGRPDNLETYLDTSTKTLPDRIWGKAKDIADDLWKDGTTLDSKVPDEFKVLYVKIGDYQDMVCGYMDEPEEGALKLTKSFANSDIWEDNACYDRSGITFTVYDSATGDEVGRFVTNASGKVTPAELDVSAGTYTIVETHSKNGFSGNGDTKTVEVTEDGTASVTFKDYPVTDPINVILEKVDTETEKSYPLDAGSLEGAEYTIRYYDGYYSTVSAAENSGSATRTWVYRTDAEGRVNFSDETFKVSGDDLYTTTKGKVTLPLGTILIEETKAPVGYLRDTKVYVRNITDNENGTSSTVSSYSIPTSKEQVKRGDLSFIKSAEGKERMAGVQFRITSNTTGESHVVVTDENGYVNTASSWNRHTNYTNRGEKATDGVWFGMDEKGNKAPIDDSLGALPYDTYTIEELRCAANEGYELVVVQATVSRNNVVIDFGTIDDTPMPSIFTDAVDAETDSAMTMADSDAVIIDKVSFNYFKVGEKYRLEGTLMNKATGMPVKDASGNDITSTKVFTCKTATGSTDVEFEFDATKLAGQDVVVFERAYRASDDVLIAIHEDITDEDQTIHFPEIGTTAKDTETSDHLAFADDSVTITDTVKYDNLIAGKTYTVTGMLMNRETGKAVKDSEGNLVVASQKFTAAKKSGSVDLTFEFSGVNLKGTTVVAFETVTYRNIPVAVHADINDEDQSVHIPEIHTSATADDTKDHVTMADGSVKITDKVSFTNLIPGKTYTLSGTLMNKATGQAVKDAKGNDITASTTFTPAAAFGTTDVVFSFNGTFLAGTTTVVYEQCLLNGVKIADHADMSDEGQTVDLPLIMTTAIDKDTKDHMSNADSEITIYDNVMYSNLNPGKVYTMTGTLMNRRTGMPVTDDKGRIVTASRIFKADRRNGSVEMAFVFSGEKLKGETLVAYETLYYGFTPVAVHANLMDEFQTIHIPEISTTGISADTLDHVTKADGEVVINDTVSYRNLIPFKEYRMTGTLMDRATGEAVLDKDGKPVTSEKTFRPNAPFGTVEMTFTFDGSDLAGTTTVVFEECTFNDILIASHSDINDEGQTVDIPEIHTTALDKEISDHISFADEEITIVDTVEYTNLNPNKEYTVKGILMDKETGEAIIDDNGNMIASETTFTAADRNGSVDVTFVFPGTNLKGKTVVGYESVTYKGIEVAVHNDLTDEAQTVDIPEIHTTAADSETADRLSFADDEITIVDTVIYKSLNPGKEYTVKGILMNKETNEPMLDDNGEEITAESTFTAEERNGSVDVTFVFPGANLRGQSVVAFEDCYFNDFKVAVHADIEDEDQTVHIPEICTTATDLETKDHVALADDDVTIVDTVSFKNLIPGKEYRMTGILMDRATGKPLLDLNDHKIMTGASFTPEASDGTVELQFQFDGTGLEGTTAVVFEDCWYNGKLIAQHADISDEEQTVDLPEVRTTAIDTETENHISYADEDITIVDTVEYSNLNPGKEYTVKGILMNKETGKPAKDDHGKKIEAEAVFTAEERDGSVELTFNFSGVKLAGDALVAFETVEYNGIKVAVHADINDENQTVFIPLVKTKASGADGNNLIKNEKDQKIYNTVMYSKLLDGEEYEMVTWLVDKKGNRMDGTEVRNTFTAKKSYGEVEAVMTFDATDHAGEKFVVFEEIYLDGKLIGSHKDLKDRNQMIKVKRPFIPHRYFPQTGDDSDLLKYGIGIFGAAALLAGYTVAKAMIRRKKREDQTIELDLDTDTIDIPNEDE